MKLLWPTNHSTDAAAVVIVVKRLQVLTMTTAVKSLSPIDGPGADARFEELGWLQLVRGWAKI
jgi:hypothetical protein